MENAWILANQVLIMFFMIVLGYGLYKGKLVSDETATQMTNIVLYVVVPCLIVETYQVEYTKKRAEELVISVLLAAIAMALGVLLSYLVRIRSSKSCRGVEQFGACMSNTGFMGIPLVTSILGSQGVFYSNTYMVLFQVVCWTFGVSMIRGDSFSYETSKSAGSDEKKSFLSMLLNPTILSVFLGLALFFCHVELPKPVNSACLSIASMNTPMAMLVSGFCMAKVNLLKALTKMRVYYVSFIKLLLIPVAIALAFKAMPFNDEIELAILIVAACPTATNTMLFARMFYKDVTTASEIFSISTILSIVSIPLIILLYQVL